MLRKKRGENNNHRIRKTDRIKHQQSTQQMASVVMFRLSLSKTQRGKN